jgi:serine protease AprX
MAGEPGTGSGHGRSWTRLVSASLGIALLGGTLGACGTSADSTALPAGDYVLRATPTALPAVLDQVTRDGGTVKRRLDSINGASVSLTAKAARRLQADRRVAALTPDAPVHLVTPTAGPAAGGSTGSVGSKTTAAYDAAADPNSLCSISKLVGVRPLWASGGTGKGVDVALIDSGVVPVKGLSGAGKILNGPDLTPESQNKNTRYLDTFGHGTHMAGIIAGHDPQVSAKTVGGSCKDFLGMAPDARIVSVKVADAHGATDVSQVIAGIDWVAEHAHDGGMNIRVLNLSFGTDSAQGYALDPLAFAAEAAWRKGIVVVVSAGNSGFDDGRLTNPALNPHVLAVGADDTKGTGLTLDDTIPSFSSRGDAKRNPDIVAPGLHVQSLRVPGSYIDSAHGDTGRLADRFFRGSGTSQAAAVTSGAIAALLSARPSLTPEQVKLLVSTLGLGLVIADPRAQGHGLLQLGLPALVGSVMSVPLVGALTDPVVGLLNGGGTASKGTGSLDAARGSERQVLDGVELTGEKDIFGKPFDSAAMAAATTAGRTWAGGTWNGTQWTGNSWTSAGWASTSWNGRTWAGRTWAGRTWADGSWNGRTWANGSWNGRTWAGSKWAGRTWAGTDFAGGDWR